MKDRNKAYIRLATGGILGFLITFGICYFWMEYKNNVGPVSGLGALFLSSIGAVIGALVSMFSKKWKSDSE